MKLLIEKISIIIDRILYRIKLKDAFTIEIQTKQSHFEKSLRKEIEEGKVDPLWEFVLGSGYFFSSREKKYIGTISSNSFMIKGNERSSDNNLVFCKGRYSERYEKVIVKTEIDGFTSCLVLYFLVILMAIGLLEDTPFAALALCLFLLIFYFKMARNVRRTKLDLMELFSSF